MIKNMKPSPKMLPRDAEILARLSDVADASYAEAYHRDANAMAAILRDTLDPSTVSGASHDRRAFIGL